MTSALAHILRKYPDLQQSLVTWLFGSYPSPGRLSIDTQRSMACSESEHSRENARPDILFTDGSEYQSAVLILENKLKDGCELTEKQPVKYMRLLAEDKPAGMVLIAPKSQIPYYEEECARRCRAANLIDPDSSQFKTPQHFLRFCSWEDLVDFLYQKASSNAGRIDEEIPTLICDLAQLKGLLNQMDETEVKPFSIDEFADLRRVAHRLPQLNLVLEKIREKLPKHAVKWSDYLRKPDLVREHGPEVSIDGKQFWLLLDFALLAKQPPSNSRMLSAFWLRIGFDRRWGNYPTSDEMKNRIKQAMEDTGRETGGMVIGEPDNCLSMALPFQTGLPGEQIVESLLGVLKKFETNLKLAV